MSPSFQFIDEVNVDKEARRQAKSHVMRGKNAGRRLHRPSKFGPDGKSLRVVKHPSQGAHERPIVKKRTLSWDLEAAQDPCHTLRSLSSPIEPTAATKDMINTWFGYVCERMYPSPLRLSPEQMKHNILRVLCSDEASYHCTISLVGTCNEFFRQHSGSSPEVLYHYDRTLKLVTQRLNGEHALSDATISLILMLVIQEQMRGERQQAEVHYEGIKRMIGLRGGLKEVEGNIPLVLKICKTDITYALQFGRPLEFIRDRTNAIKRLLDIQSPDPSRLPSSSSNPASAIRFDLASVLIDVLSFETLLNSMPEKKSIDVDTFVEIIISIGSRLLQISSILTSDNILSSVEAMYHIGLLVFLMSLFLQHNGQQAIKFELVSQRIRHVIKSINVTELEEDTSDLPLWLMFICGTWMAEDDDASSWLWTKIAALTQHLGLTSWEHARTRITKFPWVHSVHDGPGFAVWVLAKLASRAKNF